MSKPVCLVTGVGPAKGTGGEIVKRFAEGGYKVAMLARDAENLKALEKLPQLNDEEMKLIEVILRGS